MFAIFLKQDYQLPILETFAFLFATGVLLQSSLVQGYNETYIAYSYFGSGGTFALPILIFMILIWKNISFGLGGDFEKGVMQTFLTYPLGRGRMLAARLLSSVGVAFGILSLAEFLVLLVMVPKFATRQMPTLILNYLSVLATPILITMIVLLVCVFVKKSGLPLTVGLISYFVMGLFLEFFVAYALETKNAVLLAVTYLLNPAIAFQSFYRYHFNGGSTGLGISSTWGIPGFGDIATYLVGSYLVSAILLVVSILWFVRKLEV
jgi:hypothetical protein